MRIRVKKLLAACIAAALTVSALCQPGGRAWAQGEETKDAVILCVNSPLAYVKNELMPLDAANAGVNTVVEDGRAYAPLAFLNGAFGTDFTMAADVKMMGGQDFAPVRAFAEALGLEVFYDRGLIVLGGESGAYDPAADRVRIDELIRGLNALPTVDTAEKFAELMESVSSGYDVEEYGETLIYYDKGNVNGRINVSEETVPLAMSRESSAAAYDTAAAAPEAATGDYSRTNVQAEGVDEADIIKTDGQYIYVVGEGKIDIVKAVPAGDMRVDSTVRYDDGFFPSELYVDGNSMIVIGAYYNTYSEDAAPAIGRFPYTSVTRAVEYDISDKKNVKAVRTLDTVGSCVSSRKIGQDVYIITKMHAYGLRVEGGGYDQPAYRDTAAGNNDISVSYKDIYYFPGLRNSSVLNVAGFPAGKPATKATVKTYLCDGENVYASRENLYVAATDYGVMPFSVSGAYSPSTLVYKFSLANGVAAFERKGVVNGTVLNQFSMDEHNGYFRIATTSTGADGQWRNNMYILSGAMDVAGKIEDVAPGERIYSVRFMGDRAYMVTFKNVDPLFVIDMKDPAAPKILGALKIPGYSDYLHPYGENLLIGFGKDTEETKSGALVQGVKLAMFDVSDVSAPKELFKEIIGARGTDSPLLYNHKALLFDGARGLMAFPVSVTEETGDEDDFGWGQFVFQGAYVYNISPQSGFSLKGKITHMTEEDMLKSGMYGGDYNLSVNRVVTIGDTAYTASNSLLKATDLQTMKDAGQVSLED